MPCFLTWKVIFIQRLFFTLGIDFNCVSVSPSPIQFFMQKISLLYKKLGLSADVVVMKGIHERWMRLYCLYIMHNIVLNKFLNAGMNSLGKCER